MSNIEAPKALSQFRAWGIAPEIKSPWKRALKARLNSAHSFQSTTHFVVEVNRAFSAVLRDFYPSIPGALPRAGR